MIGRTIKDYRIISEIGEGGMSIVYLAENPAGEKFAIKVLDSKYTRNPQFRERFIKEAKTHAGLKHENIVSVHELAAEGDDLFLVMEYVDGTDLDRHIKLRKSLTEQEAVKILKDTLRGLEYAHNQGVIHRDLKPSNILLSVDGQAKIMDFGIALMPGTTRLTRTGITLGTAQYMSPEQIRDPKNVDHRCDLYSVGVILFEMLTGRLPFEGETEFVVFFKHVNKEAPELTEISPGASPQLGAIIKRALKKKPEDRYWDCGEFISAVEAYGRGEDPEKVIAQRKGSEKKHPLLKKSRSGAKAGDSILKRRKARKRLFLLAGLLCLLAALGLAVNHFGRPYLERFLKESVPETGLNGQPGDKPPEAAAPPAPPDLKIGVAGDFSGDLSLYGDSLQRGVEYIVDKYNSQGGLSGRQIKILVEDDRCDPEEAAFLAEKLVSGGVEFVVGHLCSEATEKALPVYSESGIVAVSPSATAAYLTESGQYRDFFRTIAPDDAPVKKQVDLAVGLGADRLALVHENSAYGRDMAGYAKKYLAHHHHQPAPVLTSAFPPEETDFTPLAEKISLSAAGVVLFWGSVQEAANLVSRLRKMGSGAILITNLADESFLKLAGDAAEGTLIAAEVPYELSAEAETAIKAYVDKYGHQPGPFYLNACAAIEVLLTALAAKEAGDKGTMADYLRSHSFDTVIGRISFDQQGDLAGLRYQTFEVVSGTFVLLTDEGGRLAEIRQRVSMGRLFVLPKPKDASVIFPESSLVYKPGMEMEAGQYQIEVSHPGFETLSKTVEIKAGQKTEVIMSLARKTPARPPQPSGPPGGVRQVRCPQLSEVENQLEAYWNNYIKDRNQMYQKLTGINIIESVAGPEACRLTVQFNSILTGTYNIRTLPPKVIRLQARPLGPGRYKISMQ